MTHTELIGGKYRVVRLIAESPHSPIYEAVQTSLERRLALRRFRDEASEQHRADVLAEARLCAQLTHPNILGVYEIGEDDGGPFVAMELLKGETLRARLARGQRLPICEVATSGAGILAALLIAHEENAVHPALSPAKVFLAKFRGGESARLSDFVERGDSDPRVDLHAAGVVIYEALTGSLPFSSEGRTRLPKGPSEIREDVGLDADAFTTRALAMRPEARFQSAEEMLDAWSSIVAIESHLMT